MSDTKYVYCLLTDWIGDGESGANVIVYETAEAAHEAFMNVVEEERREDILYQYQDVVEEFSEESETYCIYREGYFLDNHLQMSVVKRELR